MVQRERRCVLRRQIEEIRGAVGEEVLGACERRLEDLVTQDPRSAAVLGDEQLVHREHGGLRNPPRVHLASSRRAFLYRAMKDSAVSIAAENSGS
jgi:hypothetical protein